MRKILFPCVIIVACSAANAGGPMYNTPVSNIAKITQIIGTCDKEESASKFLRRMENW